MSDLKTSLQQLAERGTPVGSERLRQRVAMDLAESPAGTPARTVPGWAIAVAVAAAVLVVLGITSVLLGGSDGAVVPLPPAQTTSTVPASTTAPTTTIPAPTTVPETPARLGPWNPILTETVAKAPPTPATCPTGAAPDVAGPSDQERPGEGPWSNQAAVFDTHAGRIVYVDEVGRTWTFDVCTNTWEWMQPSPAWVDTGSVMLGELVYDIDSDVTIAFRARQVGIYDANTNSWSSRPTPPDVDSPGLGAVYDPMSGLVLMMSSDGMLRAYDVDTDTWTDVGMIMEPRVITSEGQTQQVVPPFLIGYAAETDRLALLHFIGAPFQDPGGLLNLRTGDITGLEQPDTGVRGGFGSFSYAAGGETAYVFTDGVCRLNPISSAWECHEGPYPPEGPSAMVYDPINERIVVINDFCCNWPGTTVTDVVYAIDFNTGERIELLAESRTRTETDGS